MYKTTVNVQSLIYNETTRTWWIYLPSPIVREHGWVKPRTQIYWLYWSVFLALQQTDSLTCIYVHKSTKENMSICLKLTLRGFVVVVVNCIYRMDLKNWERESFLWLFRGIVVSIGNITLEDWNNLIIFGFHE